MAGDGPDWARDVVLTELRRRWPDSIEKTELQAAVGIGPGDLRGVLSALIVSGEVREVDEGAEAGYEYVDVEDRAAFAEQVERDADAVDDAIDELEEAGLVEVTEETTARPGVSYRAGILLHVTFVPEGDEGDRSAVLEADQIRAAALNGVLAEFPDLAVASTLGSLEAFGEPRRVV
jgi:hypothetical protein